MCKPKISTAFFGSSCSGKESKGKLGSGSECSGSASLPFYTVSSTGTGTGGTGTGGTGTGGTVPNYKTYIFICSFTLAESGSRKKFRVRMDLDPDPKHCLKEKLDFQNKSSGSPTLPGGLAGWRSKYERRQVNSPGHLGILFSLRNHSDVILLPNRT